MTLGDDFEQLKTARSSAYEDKKRARFILDDSHFLLLEAVDNARMAYWNMRRAYNAKAKALSTYLSTKGANQPQITRLNQTIEEAFANVRQAADLARAAYLSGDHPLAREQSRTKVSYIDLKRDYMAERSELVIDIQSQRIKYEEAAETFEAAKVAFRIIRDACEPLIAASEKAECAYQSACDSFDMADRAVRECVAARSTDERALIIQAGVPSEFVDRTWVKYSPDGVRHFYFGGVGLPDGDGHAHYVMQPDGSITYTRDPCRSRNINELVEASV